MKRILALVLCFVMVFSLVAVAEETAAVPAATTEFSDVSADNQYKEAITTLSNLGIILGDAGATTFRPEAGITRAEFCVIVARFIGMGDLNTIAETPFTDVTTALCDEWKVKAVRIASDLGIVAGMGDGTFQPDSPVTYEQAVKMLVCYLNYEQTALDLGGWPAGYISAGTQIGLTKKVVATGSEAAPRQIIAQLVFNAFDIPKMGGSIAGVATGGSTIQDNSLKYKELTGIVTATNTLSLTADGKTTQSGKVLIGNRLFNVGSSGIDRYFGREVHIYYSLVDDEYTIQSGKPTKLNNEATFSPKEIKHLAQRQIQIYTDEDYDDYDSYSVEEDVKFLYNNYLAPYVEESAGYLDEEYKPYSGNLTMIDNDGNNDIDVILITDAKPFVVSAIDSTNKLLYNAYDSSDILDLSESSSKKITIKKGSATLTFSSIAKNTVLMVSKSRNDKHINIEILSNTKTGVIKSMSKEDREITIGTETYEISDLCWGKYESKFQMDSSVTVYLDNHNTVVYVIENAAGASSYTYGYLITTGKEGRGGAGEQTIVAKLFTQANMLNTYPFAEKVKYYGYNPENKDAPYKGEQLSPEEVLEVLESSARTDINQDDSAVTTDYSQLVKYSLNAKSEINAIFTSVPTEPGLTTSSNLILGTGTKSAKYKSGTNMLGTNAVNSSTKFFFVPTDRNKTDDYSVGKNSNLANQRSYTYETYDLESGIAKVAVVFGDTSLPVYDISNPIVVVSKIQEVSGEDGATHKFFVNCSSDSYTTENIQVLSDVKVGDVIKIKRNNKGIVTEVMPLYSPADNFLYEFESGAKRLANTDDIDIRNATASDSINGDFCIMQGTVAQKYDENMFISLNDVTVEIIEDDEAEDGEEGEDEEPKTKVDLDMSELYPVSLTSSPVCYTYSKSKGTIEKQQTLISFEDGKASASKVYISLVDGTPRFILTVID